MRRRVRSAPANRRRSACRWRRPQCRKTPSLAAALRGGDARPQSPPTAGAAEARQAEQGDQPTHWEAPKDLLHVMFLRIEVGGAPFPFFCWLCEPVPPVSRSTRHPCTRLDGDFAISWRSPCGCSPFACIVPWLPCGEGQRRCPDPRFAGREGSRAVAASPCQRRGLARRVVVPARSESRSGDAARRVRVPGHGRGDPGRHGRPAGTRAGDGAAR